MTSPAAANALAVVPEDLDAIQPGQDVECRSLD
jgi:hypothetical protein